VEDDAYLADRLVVRQAQFGTVRCAGERVSEKLTM
jgi:hypothetical protein